MAEAIRLNHESHSRLHANQIQIKLDLNSFGLAFRISNKNKHEPEWHKDPPSQTDLST